MSKKQSYKRKTFVIADKPYSISLTARSGELNQPFSICITIRADYGQRSTCLVRGLQNYDRWANYGYWDHLDEPGAILPIEVTPKVLCQIIELAHERGWDPINSKSNCEIQINNQDVLKMDNPNESPIVTLQSRREELQ